MRVKVLAVVAVNMLAVVCAARSHNLPDFLGLRTRQLNLATANNLRDQRSLRDQQLPSSSSSVDAIWALTKTRRHAQRLAGPTFSDQTASIKNRVRPRSKRGAIVNGFTSWDYEPFDKMGAFRTGRERPSKREVVRSLMNATDSETAEEDVERDYNKLAPHPKATIAWVEPEILSSCWTQVMHASRHTFVPSCNMDDTYSSKQCYKQRCWCVNSAGQPVKINPSAKRFYYLADAVRLICPTVIASSNTKTD